MSFNPRFIDAVRERQEREDAMYRYLQYRRERLFWRLWGIPMEVAELISEQVWGVDTPQFDRQGHCHPRGKLVGFKSDDKDRHPEQ
jgi:hypothetical protein